MNKKIIICFYFLLFSLYANASFNMNANCQKAYQEILKLNFNEAREIIKTEKLNNNNLIPFYLENCLDFYKIFISEDKEYFEKIKGNKDIRINKLKTGNINSPYYLYTQAEVNIQWAIMRVKFGEYYTAGMEIYKAYNLLIENKSKFPDFILNDKSLGVLHSIIGTIPESYSWMLKLSGMNGSIKQGINELIKTYNNVHADNNYKFIENEVLFYLVFLEINFNYEKEKTKKYLEMLNARLASSPFIIFAASQVAHKLGDNDKVITILSTYKTNNQFTFYYLYYLLAKAKMYRLDEDAIKYLSIFKDNFKGKNYIKECNQKIAWYYLLKNNDEKYNEYMKNVSIYGSTDVDEDKQALEEFNSKKIPNKTLLKARLFFDGGYYNKALTLLTDYEKNIGFNIKIENIEYNYRLARIYDKQNNINNAIKYYKIVIEKENPNYSFFSANSALNIGLLYKTLDEKKLANQYFNLCLSIDNHPYYNSLSQKAKANICK